MIERLISRVLAIKINVPIARLQAFVFCLLPFAVYATVADFNEQFGGFTTATLFSLGSLIFCGTLSGMLHRLKNEYRVNGTVRHPLIFVSSDLVGGVFVGVLCVLVGFGNNWANYIVACATGGGAFLGSMMVEQLWQIALKRYAPNNPDTKLGQLIESVKGAPQRSDERTGPISRRGITGDGDGNIGKYD